MVESKLTPQTTKRRLSHDFVRENFEIAGLTLVSKAYDKAREPLEVLCKNGHEIKLTWNDFQQGRRCSLCAGNSTNLPFIKAFAKENGFELLSDRYDSTNTRMIFRCFQGHEFTCTWNNMRQRKRCPECDRVAVVVTIDDVRKAGEAVGLRLLSDLYVNNAKKLEFVCQKGHLLKKTWSVLANQKNRECDVCLASSTIESLLNSDGYELLDYAGSHKFMSILCPDGHTASMYPGSFKAGSRCVRCVRGGMTAEEVRDQMRLKARIAGSVRKLILVRSKRSHGSERAPFSQLTKQTSADILRILGVRPTGHDLDHIVPQAFFDFRHEQEIEACWSIDNLRYLPSLENQTRRHVLTSEEVHRFTPNQLEILIKASLKPQVWVEYVEAIS